MERHEIDKGDYLSSARTSSRGFRARTGGNLMSGTTLSMEVVREEVRPAMRCKMSQPDLLKW